MRSISRIVFIIFIVAASHAAWGEGDEKPVQPVPKPRGSEFAHMLGAILLHGADMGPNTGWFHPSECCYNWAWLAERFDRNKDGVLEPEELKGSAALFQALDRDGDGAVSSDDLDWSPRSRYLQSRAEVRGKFGRLDRNGNGRISREEWEKAFEQAAKGKNFLTQNDIADLLYPTPRRPAPAPDGKPAAAEEPSHWLLLKGLFAGELGSASEGPSIGQEAPGFALETHDKARRISLADYRGKKPVVLVFGSFT